MTDTNFEEVAPESWCCVDCGINTAPGFPRRAEIEQAMKTLCLRSDPNAVRTLRFDQHCEVYFVRESVWKASDNEPWGGCLCIGCLEKRLGRTLTPKDFDRRHPFMPGTERLIQRRGGVS
jgi:hypothetical protein